MSINSLIGPTSGYWYPGNVLGYSLTDPNPLGDSARVPTSFHVQGSPCFNSPLPGGIATEHSLMYSYITWKLKYGHRNSNGDDLLIEKQLFPQ